jgi:hypothetical protein
MRSNAASQLRPGEQIQAVFSAQTAPFWYIYLGYIVFLAMNTYYVIVVTDQRILVCQSGKMSMSPVKSTVRELPRQTVIGPASGLWYKTNVLGEKMLIAKRFHKDVAAADSLAQTGSVSGVG